MTTIDHTSCMYWLASYLKYVYIQQNNQHSEPDKLMPSTKRRLLPDRQNSSRSIDQDRLASNMDEYLDQAITTYSVMDECNGYVEQNFPVNSFE